MATDPHWTSYLSALLTPIVAVLGSFIAYRQWILARNKLKLDLFERRLSIYNSVIAFLMSITINGTIKEEEFYKFIASTSQTRWLINESMAKYFTEEFFSKYQEFNIVELRLHETPVGETRKKLVAQKAEIREWFSAQRKIIDDKFAEYLQINH